MNPAKLLLYFGNSAAPNLYNYVAVLVLYGTQGSVRGLNRWEYEWLALSPKFNVKQHRWRENSYVFKLTNRWSKLYNVRFCGVFRVEAKSYAVGLEGSKRSISDPLFTRRDVSGYLPYRQSDRVFVVFVFAFVLFLGAFDTRE